MMWRPFVGGTTAIKIIKAEGLTPIDEGYTPDRPPKREDNEFLGELENALADHDSCVARLMHMPRWMLSEYLKQSILAAVWRLSGNKRMHVAAAWEASYLKGYLGGYRREILKQKTES